MSTNSSAATALASLAYPEMVEQISKLVEVATEADVVFGPLLSDDALLCFERANGCILPLEYRMFLLFAGNGASGTSRSEILPVCLDARMGSLSKPFALEEGWYQSGDDEEVEAGGEDFHPYMVAVYEAEEILSQGCLMFRGDVGRSIYLVVTGKDAGQIMNLEDNYYQDGSWSVRITNEGGFLSWYEDVL